MDFKSFLTVVHALLALLASQATAATYWNSTRSAVTRPCNSNCVHRLLYRSAYSAATTGLKMTFRACDAFDWCADDAKGWCPDAVNYTITDIASHMVTDCGIDFNNVDNITLLSTMSSISSKSTRLAISRAQVMLDESPLTCSEDQMRTPRKLQWHLSQQEAPSVYNASYFDLQIANAVPDEIPNYSNNDEDDDTLSSVLPWLAAPAVLLGPLIGAGFCAADPILCGSVTSGFLPRFFSAAQKILPESSWLRQQVFDEASQETTQGTEEVPKGTKPGAEYGPKKEAKIQRWLDEVADDPPEETSEELWPEEEPSMPDDAPYQRPEVPELPPNDGPRIKLGKHLKKYPKWKYSDWPDTIPEEVEPIEPVAEPGFPDSEPSTSDTPLSEASEPTQLFRSERYNIFTNTLEQQTLRPITDAEQTAELMREAGRTLSTTRELPYELLDSASNVVRTLWRKPETLAPMPGDWVPRGRQFVRMTSRRVPVLNSLGEPIIASLDGTLMSLEPAAAAIGLAATEGEVASAAGAAAGLMGPAAVAFSMLLPEGGHPSIPFVSFNPLSGLVDLALDLPFGGDDSGSDREDNGGIDDADETIDAENKNDHEDNAADDLNDGGSGHDTHSNADHGEPDDKHETEHAVDQTATKTTLEAHVLSTAATTLETSGHSNTADPRKTPLLSKSANDGKSSLSLDTATTHKTPTHSTTSVPLDTSSLMVAMSSVSSKPASSSTSSTSTSSKISSSTPLRSPHIAASTTRGATAQEQTPRPTRSQDTVHSNKQTLNIGTHNNETAHEFPATSVKWVTSTRNVTSVASVTSTKKVTSVTSVTSTKNITLVTLVTSVTSTKNITLATPSSAPIATITDCDTIGSCPICDPGVECRIGNLPSMCVVDAMGLEALDEWGPDQREECDFYLTELSREEKKAWAVNITPPNCLSIDDWEPKDLDLEHGHECHFVLDGFNEIETETWIAGLLPLGCPNDKEGFKGWDNDDLKNRCLSVVKTLSSAFNN